jgi:hypothetical protein
MINSKNTMQKLFQQVVGMKPTRVKLGFGSFITMDFGKDIPEEVKTRQGIQVRYHGEWHLWIYQCSWEVYQNKILIAHTESSKDEIDSALLELANKRFTSFTLLNEFFDADLTFENMTLRLLHRKEGEQWLLFTPENKTLVAGPGAHWDYRDSG